ncbi:hypothetical protein FHS29_004616 [Saccharothrix tamanrassetensis]|uniref:Uncharacterized protein n=1 Tax=Saccharothrix tamanrassetensis TaxID=1051531 RepID=A0A841CPD9_9PSEU|nr:hypothetical protein [Saccharothrix tamanrassetensis]MBB5958008.1 hypothetical protein [Saccharothrix tamanrassetensis]
MSLRVARDGTDVLVGDWPSHPERTALLEARGALLAWDVPTDDAVPAARIHDAARAADWLWEVYGAAADGILGDSDAVEIGAGDWRVRDACRVVAHLGWAEAWWPASAAAGVPALDPVLLLAERAVATCDVEHLLDDEDAAVRALAAVTADPAVDGLSARLAVLAEDYGVVVPQVVRSSRAEYALAAGDTVGGGGVTVHSGTDAVDWALVPSGAVDAAAEARWAVVRNGGSTFLDVTVPAGPRPDVRLAARFGQVDIALDRTDGLGWHTGRTPVPPTVLLLPPAERRLTVYAPDFAVPERDPDPDAPARRAAIIDYARSRPDSPTATLTERLAGRR